MNQKEKNIDSGLRVKGILYIVNASSPEGDKVLEPFNMAQIESIRQQGLEVDILNIQANRIKWNYFKAPFRLRKLLKKKQFDIIHGHYVYSGLIAATQRMAPSIVSFMGSDLNGAPKENGKMQLRGYIDILLSHILEFFIGGIVVKTTGMHNRLYRKNKSMVLPNGVDFNVFRPIDRLDARKYIGLDLSPERKYIIFLGGPGSPVNKGYNLAKKIEEILKERDPYIELLTVHGITHSEIPYYMNAADVMIFPSLREGSPNVVKEAMACNLPIVSTDVGDVSEVIKGVSGCRIVKREPQDFADAIWDNLKTTKRTNGRQHIEHLRIENIAGQLIQFYEAIIEKGMTKKS